VDDPQALDRSRAEARGGTVAFEMLAGLHFEHHDQALVLVFQGPGARPVEVVRLSRPDANTFRGQLDLVAQYAELRDDRGGEILAQVSGALDFVASILGLNAERHKHTLELLAAALGLVNLVEMRLKLGFAVPRPVQLSPQIQPMLPTPGHASWPSGHATESFLVLGLLRHLWPGQDLRNEQLKRLAARVAVNRTVAGLHYPVDSAAGRLLGTSLAEFVRARSGVGPVFQSRHFDGRHYPPAEDFDPRLPLEGAGAPAYHLQGPAHSLASSVWLGSLWRMAAAEWV